MFLSRFKISAAAVLLFAATNFAQNVLSNGNMEYGDGGWYLWNNPDGPAKVELKLAEPGLGFDGSQGAKLVVKELPKIWWGLQLQPPKFLADSAYYKLTFKAKGNMPINAVVQGGAPDYRQKESASFELTDKWQTYSMTFLADQKGYGVNNVTFHVGLKKGWLQMDDVAIEKLGSLNSDWYAAADSRIDSLRKTKITVKANPDEQVHFKLTKHAFPFGTALALYKIEGNSKQDSIEKWFRSAAKKYFWYGVPENQFKWPEYEPKKGKLKKEELQEYISFAEKNKWKLRGHAIMWGIQQYNYDKHFSNPTSPKECKDFGKYLKLRIERDLKEYKGKFAEYDVWNEPLHEAYTFNMCGWNWLDSAFMWAHQVDLTAKLFINDYNVVAAGETDRYVTLIQGMLKRKIPIHGIGVQCHFGLRPVVPELIHERLDKLAALGLPIEVTELDFGDWQVGMNDPEEVQAEKYETFLRTVFSHPAVSGVLLWGFWDNHHWIKNGGIIASDGREKPAAKTIYNLWHKTWTTDTTATANADGIAEIRGFKGVYEITIDGKKQFIGVE